MLTAVERLSGPHSGLAAAQAPPSPTEKKRPLPVAAPLVNNTDSPSSKRRRLDTSPAQLPLQPQPEAKASKASEAPNAAVAVTALKSQPELPGPLPRLPQPPRPTLTEPQPSSGTASAKVKSPKSSPKSSPKGGAKALTENKKIPRAEDKKDSKGSRKDIKESKAPVTGSTHTSSKVVCDRCDGPHASEVCPFFKKRRDKHPDAQRNKQGFGMASSGGNALLPRAKVCLSCDCTRGLSV